MGADTRHILIFLVGQWMCGNFFPIELVIRFLFCRSANRVLVWWILPILGRNEIVKGVNEFIVFFVKARLVVQVFVFFIGRELQDIGRTGV